MEKASNNKEHRKTLVFIDKIMLAKHVRLRNEKQTNENKTR